MEFNKGDLVIATSLDRRRNSFINGDIVQIVAKYGYNNYKVKIIYKKDTPSLAYEHGWYLQDEYKYFELFE